jgi:hypothetical protein
MSDYVIFCRLNGDGGDSVLIHSDLITLTSRIRLAYIR